jgi:hypothetical protein
VTGLASGFAVFDAMLKIDCGVARDAGGMLKEVRSVLVDERFFSSFIAESIR